MNTILQRFWENNLKQFKTRGNISEVFASIQGEGLFVGTTQLFIRLAPVSEQPLGEETFVLRTLPGQRNQFAKNPISPGRLHQLLADTYPLDQFFCISFIGDDPLHQADFLAELLPIFGNAGIQTFVQTSGTPIAEFTRLAPLVNRWCIDLKCSLNKGSIRGVKTLERIIELATPENTYFRLAIDVDDDPEKLLGTLSSLQLDDFTLVLQPWAVFPAHISDWDTGTIINWIQLFKPYFFQVRWIPQVHKLLRIL